VKARPIAPLSVALGIVLGVALAPACGRKGPLELPPGRTPQPVAGFAAAAENGDVVLTWVNPAKTVAGTPLGPLEQVEIWIFERDAPAPGTVLTAEAVEKTARLLTRIFADSRGEALSHRLRLAAVEEKRIAFTARVLDRKGRVSAFSPPAVIAFDRPPEARVPEREGS